MITTQSAGPKQQTNVAPIDKASAENRFPLDPCLFPDACCGDGEGWGGNHAFLMFSLRAWQLCARAVKLNSPRTPRRSSPNWTRQGRLPVPIGRASERGSAAEVGNVVNFVKPTLPIVVCCSMECQGSAVTVKN